MANEAVNPDTYIDSAVRAVTNKRPVPEIDFSLHTMEDGSQVSTLDRVCKGKSTCEPPVNVCHKFQPLQELPRGVVDERTRRDDRVLLVPRPRHVFFVSLIRQCPADGPYL